MTDEPILPNTRDVTELVEKFAREICDTFDLEPELPICEQSNFGSDEPTHKIIGYSLKRFYGAALTSQAEEIADLKQKADRWHSAAMQAGVIVCSNGSLIYADKEKIATLTTRIGKLKGALSFYRDEWRSFPVGDEENGKVIGYEAEPTRKLLDDEGSIARAALTKEKGE